MNDLTESKQNIRGMVFSKLLAFYFLHNMGYHTMATSYLSRGGKGGVGREGGKDKVGHGYCIHVPID